MFKICTDKIISFLVLGSFLGLMTPIAAQAQQHEALYDSQAEVEQTNANLEETEGGYEQSVEELRQAQADVKAMTRKNKEVAAHTAKEIQRLQTKQAANAKETGLLIGKTEVLNQEIKKNEHREASVRAKAEAVAEKLETARSQFQHSKENHLNAVKNLQQVHADHASLQAELKGIQAKLAAAKTKEKKSAQTLAAAKSKADKFEAYARPEAQRLDNMTQAALASAESNMQKAQMLLEKRKQQQQALEIKRQRLSEAKAKQKKALARVSSASSN